MGGKSIASAVSIIVILSSASSSNFRMWGVEEEGPPRGRSSETRRCFFAGREAETEGVKRRPTPCQMENARDVKEERRPEADACMDITRVGLSETKTSSRGLFFNEGREKRPNLPDGVLEKKEGRGEVDRVEEKEGGEEREEKEEEEEEEGRGGGGGGGGEARRRVPPRVFELQSQPLKTSARTDLGVWLRRRRKFWRAAASR